jgi:hypothetical protein
MAERLAREIKTQILGARASRRMGAAREQDKVENGRGITQSRPITKYERGGPRLPVLEI